jgi:hypothetical protein
MEDKINIAREKLEITFPLKEQQLETLFLVTHPRGTLSIFVLIVAIKGVSIIATDV